MAAGRQRRTDEAPRRVQRWDRTAQIAADLDPASRTADGYLRAHAAVAVPGVMEYVNADGSITRELIPPDELHDVDSLRSLAGLPVTLGHPREDVSPDNVGTYGVGAMGNDVEILANSGHVRVLLVLHRRDALEAVDNGTVEVSPGYTTVIDPTPGEHPVYGRYDAIQRQRRYNHLAVVDQARGGHTVKLRADRDERRATRRCDSVPDDPRVAQRVKLDTAPPTTTPTPAPRARGGNTVHPFLITLSALLALPYTRADDGQLLDKRSDAAITEDQLMAAIADAIRDLREQAQAAEDTQPAEGELSREQLQAKITELEGELAAMRQADEQAKADAAAEQERADCAELEQLADRMGYDRSAWTADTRADERRLQLAKARQLVDAEAVLRSDSAPQGVDPLLVRGMVKALRAQHPADGTGTQRTDQWQPLHLQQPPPSNPGSSWGGPSGRTDSAAPADPMKAAIKRRNDQRLGRGKPAPAQQ